MLSVFKKLKNSIQVESNSLQKWIPCLIGVGIICYFNSNFNITFVHSCLAIFISLIFYIIAHIRKVNRSLYIASAAVFFILLGYNSAIIRVHYIESPKIIAKYEKVWVQGILESIDEREKTKRLLITDLKITSITKSRTPKRIRINTKANVEEVSVGDRIGFFASLIPPPQEVIPNGFNFAKFAYFKQIGAIGYTISNVKILEKRVENYEDIIKNIRIKILESFKSNIEQAAAGIAIALFVGDTTKVPKKEFEEIKISGISHLLAISGMHITLVAGILYFATRFVFVRIQTIALRIDSKKLASVIAILGASFYLLIAGCPVSAQRAFYMTALVLFGLIIDRTINPMRTISVAAIVIFLAAPETILSPSLQMSFSACLGLIFGFSYISKKLSNLIIFKNAYLNKCFKYLISIIAATVLATMTTTPFIAYHFRYFSTYSIIANLLIIPINDFLIMPLGIVGIILMPLNLEFIGFKLMGLSIKVILLIVGFISQLPEASIKMPYITDASIFLFTLSGVSLIIFKTNLRYMSCIFLLLGVFLAWGYSSPDILISESGETVAVKNRDKLFFLYSAKGERYIKKVWREEFNIQGDLIKDKLVDKRRNSNCNERYCVYNNNLKAVLVKDSSYLDINCKIKPELFINLSLDSEYICKFSMINLNKRNFANNGAHAIWLGSNKHHPIIKSVSADKKGKPWDKYTVGQ